MELVWASEFYWEDLVVVVVRTSQRGLKVQVYKLVHFCCQIQSIIQLPKHFAMFKAFCHFPSSNIIRKTRSSSSSFFLSHTAHLDTGHDPIPSCSNTHGCIDSMRWSNNELKNIWAGQSESEIYTYTLQLTLHYTGSNYHMVTVTDVNIISIN